MNSLKFLIIFLSISLFSFSQKEETKMGVKVSYGFYPTIFTNYGLGINSTKVDLGLDFQKENSDIYLYLSYGFNMSSSYSGHYLGASLEYHFLSNQRIVRPYFGISILSEIATNYKEGFLQDSSFLPMDTYILLSEQYGKEAYYSGFYHSTPFFGTASLGCDFRLIKDLYLNLSLGYGLQLMKYKYLEWQAGDDYREMLNQTSVESRVFHYLNAEIGLSYAFSFHKKEKPQP